MQYLQNANYSTSHKRTSAFLSLIGAKTFRHCGNSNPGSKMKRKLNKTKDDSDRRVKLDISGPIQPPILASLTNRSNKYTVLKLLRDNRNRSNRLMCELRMSLFVAAALDPNPDNCLLPFPTCFIKRKKETKDFAGLLNEIKKIPKILTIFAESTNLPHLTWKLLNCVFNNRLTLEPLVNQIATKLKEFKLATGLDDLPIPNNKDLYMFSITPIERRPKFSEAKMKYGTKFAFHGSSVQNFHSIVHRGLMCSLNVRSGLGHGTYMSPGIEMAKIFALPGQGWDHSLFGNTIQCVAVVEVVMSPDTKVFKNFFQKNSIYVCDNDDHMQLSHLYVYRN